MDTTPILNAIDAGHETPEDIATAVDESIEDVATVLTELENRGIITQHVDNLDEPTYEVVVTEDEVPADITPDSEPSGMLGRLKSKLLAQRMPVNRDYDWDDYVPENVPEYYESDNELTKAKAEIETRQDEYGRLPRFWFTGPTGSAKTLAARRLAQELDAVLITIQCKYSMNEAAVVGSPMLIDGDTVWSDGPGVKALLASQDRVVILLLDEINRARPEAKSVLLSMLDDRAELKIEQRGDERIVGNPENLITIATTNEGPGHMVEKIDLAEKRRIGNKHRFGYLGMGDADGETKRRDTEARLIAERSGAPFDLATEMVDVANEIRREAEASGTKIRRGVPPAKLIDWAQTAYSYNKSDAIDNPLMSAAETAVLNPFYDEKADELNEVTETIRSAINDAPFDPDDYDEWAASDMNDHVDEPTA